MDLNENLKNNIQRLRKERNITQEVLAVALEISVQAISKWETGISLPDIMQLPRIAKFFGVTIDYLFYNEDNAQPSVIKTLPNDDTLRIIQFKGNKMLGMDNWDKDKEILLRFPNEFPDNQICREINFEIWGNSTIRGDISGYVECKGSINCGNIGAYAECAGGINCANVESYVECGGSVNCGTISGYVECTGDLSCSDIMSYVECNGNIRCKAVHGSVECDGDIVYEK